MRFSRLALASSSALALTLLTAMPAHSADSARRVAAERQLARAAYAHGPQDLIRARAEFEAMSKAEPKSATLHYWLALADWRLVPRLDDARQAQRYCLDGLDHAGRAIKLDPKFAEALAVKAGLQGLSLRFDPNAVMTVGLEIEANLKRALELAPANPRVLLIDALNTLHKPAFIGGGADRALPKFVKADELFAAEKPTDGTAPSWGHEEALIWAGRSALQLGDFTVARGFYDRALALDPENGWVEHTLIPELEKAAQAAAAKKDQP